MEWLSKEKIQSRSEKKKSHGSRHERATWAMMMSYFLLYYLCKMSFEAFPGSEWTFERRLAKCNWSAYS